MVELRSSRHSYSRKNVGPEPEVDANSHCRPRRLQKMSDGDDPAESSDHAPSSTRASENDEDHMEDLHIAAQMVNLSMFCNDVLTALVGASATSTSSSRDGKQSTREEPLLLGSSRNKQSPARLTLTDCLKVSRPGFWFVSIYMYLAPTGGMYYVFGTVRFWLGLAYICFPVNLLVYGMNDYSDVLVDQNSDRKGNWLFGAKLAVGKLRQLPAIALLAQGVPVLGMLLLYWSTSLRAEESLSPRSPFGFVVGLAVFYLGGLIFNVLYNFHPFRWSGKPPLEPICSICGYLLVSLFSALANDLPYANIGFQLYAGLMILRTQYWFELFDWEEDLARGRPTTVHLPLLWGGGRRGESPSRPLLQGGGGAAIGGGLAEEGAADHMDILRTAKRRGGYIVLCALLFELLAGLLLFPGHWVLPLYSLLGMLLLWTTSLSERGAGASAKSEPLEGRSSCSPEAVLHGLQTVGGAYLVWYQWTSGIFVGGGGY